MLPYAFRFTATNSTGQTIAQNNIVVYYRLKKLEAQSPTITSTEKGLYQAEQTLIVNSAGTVTNGATASSALVEHGGWTAGDFMLKVVAPESASGTVTLTCDKALDTTPTHVEAAGTGTQVASITFAAAGTKYAYFSL